MSQSPLWGPPTEPPEFLKFSGAPYQPFSKGDKLGKVSDWVADPAKDGKDTKRPGVTHGQRFRDQYQAYGAASSSFFTADESEAQDSSWSFSIVDSSAKNAPGKSSSGSGSSSAVLRSRSRQQTNRPTSSNGPSNSGPRSTTVGSTVQQRGGHRGGPPMGNRWNQNDRNKNREPSIPIKHDWNLIQSNNFGELMKLSYSVNSAGEVLGRYGYVPLYNKAMDKLLQPKRLKQVDVTSYNVTTTEDPIIQSLAKEKKARMYATDTIISLLMCATKTNNPWDVIVHKVDGQIFLDKREGGALDFLTVDENAHIPPSDTAESRMDTTQQLGVEATYINQNFAANVVQPNTSHEFEHPNPFSDGSEPASDPLLPQGYIYKSFNLEANPEAPEIPLVVRLEVDAASPDSLKKDQMNLISVKSLNEYGAATKQGGKQTLEWRNRFSSHRGAIVAAEMKNNLAKLSRWTTAALLADVKQMKIGFVSRLNSRDPGTHEIVCVLTYDPKQFASQLGLHLENGWGVVKSIYNIFSSLDDGTYVILRDPNATSLKIYQVPEGSSVE